MYPGTASAPPVHGETTRLKQKRPSMPLPVKLPVVVCSTMPMCRALAAGAAAAIGVYTESTGDLTEQLRNAAVEAAANAAAQTEGISAGEATEAAVRAAAFAAAVAFVAATDFFRPAPSMEERALQATAAAAAAAAGADMTEAAAAAAAATEMVSRLQLERERQQDLQTDSDGVIRMPGGSPPVGTQPPGDIPIAWPCPGPLMAPGEQGASKHFMPPEEDVPTNVRQSPAMAGDNWEEDDGLRGIGMPWKKMQEYWDRVAVADQGKRAFYLYYLDKVIRNACGLTLTNDKKPPPPSKAPPPPPPSPKPPRPPPWFLKKEAAPGARDASSPWDQISMSRDRINMPEPSQPSAQGSIAVDSSVTVASAAAGFSMGLVGTPRLFLPAFGGLRWRSHFNCSHPLCLLACVCSQVVLLRLAAS